MTGTEQLKQHERRVGYLKMAISLGLDAADRVAEDLLHPRENSTGVIVTLMTVPQDFINELN